VYFLCPDRLARKLGIMLGFGRGFSQARVSGTVSIARLAATGTYEVIRRLPTDGDDCQYRIKSSIEAFERVATESQLDIP
jgi:hypothetical protein